MRGWGAALLVAAALAAAPVAAAEPPAKPQQQSPSELLDEAGQKLVQALKMMLMAIPQYSAPEILDNGDIIIRRVRPQDAPKEAPKKDEPPAEPGKPVQTRI